MKIAELFVSLGVKGNDTSKTAIKGVKDGLGDAKSMAFETKAAIAAVVYGLERMMSQSAQMGTGLSQFSALTGVATDDLQKWQYAMRQTGGSAEELTGNVKAVQNAMTNMLLGKGAPEGMAMLANKIGFDPKRARDTLYVMGQLQKMAQQMPQDVGNAMLKSFGLSEGTISAMRKNAFRQDVFGRAPVYSGNEVNQLNKVDVAWGNLGQKIQMAFGHFTAKKGLGIVQDLSKVTDQAIKLAEAFANMADKMKFFQTVGQVFEGMASTLKLMNEVVDKFNGKDTKGGMLDSGTGETFPGFNASPVGKFLSSLSSGNAAVPQVDTSKIPVPAVAPNVKIDQQHLHFNHDGKEHKKNQESHKKAAEHAYNQSPARAWIA